jgi:hypothetical protein
VDHTLHPDRAAGADIAPWQCHSCRHCTLIIPLAQTLRPDNATGADMATLYCSRIKQWTLIVLQHQTLNSESATESHCTLTVLWDQTLTLTLRRIRNSALTALQDQRTHRAELQDYTLQPGSATGSNTSPWHCYRGRHCTKTGCKNRQCTLGVLIDQTLHPDSATVSVLCQLMSVLTVLQDQILHLDTAPRQAAKVDNLP